MGLGFLRRLGLPKDLVTRINLDSDSHLPMETGSLMHSDLRSQKQRGLHSVTQKAKPMD